MLDVNGRGYPIKPLSINSDVHYKIDVEIKRTERQGIFSISIEVKKIDI